MVEITAAIRHVETATVNILNGEILPSNESDEFQAWKENSKNIPSIESYYFSSKGNLLGLVPSTRMVMTIEGPFLSFDPKSRILTNMDGKKVLLVSGKEEKTNMPKLNERTKKELKKLVIR